MPSQSRATVEVVPQIGQRLADEQEQVQIIDYLGSKPRSTIKFGSFLLTVLQFT